MKAAEWLTTVTHLLGVLQDASAALRAGGAAVPSDVTACIRSLAEISELLREEPETISIPITDWLIARVSQIRETLQDITPDVDRRLRLIHEGGL